jgi:acetylornithine aminotransferase
VELSQPTAGKVAAAALGQGFIVNDASPTRVRFAPPLVIGHDDIDAFLAAWPGILDDAYGGPR